MWMLIFFIPPQKMAEKINISWSALISVRYNEQSLNVWIQVLHFVSALDVLKLPDHVEHEVRSSSAHFVTSKSSNNVCSLWHLVHIRISHTTECNWIQFSRTNYSILLEGLHCALWSPSVTKGHSYTLLFASSV